MVNPAAVTFNVSEGRCDGSVGRSWSTAIIPFHRKFQWSFASRPAGTVESPDLG
jgi:hypothetical protein